MTGTIFTSERRQLRRRVKHRLQILLVLAPMVGLSLWLFARGRTQWRRQRFDSVIVETARRHGVNAFLVKAVIMQESQFDPLATGAAGEIGLMQLMGGAVQDWETQHGRQVAYPGLLYDPRLNVEIGTWYLARAMRQWRQYRDAEVLALGQYNAGGSNAKDWAPQDPRENALERVSFPATKQYIISVQKYRTLFEQDYHEREAN